MKNKNKKGIQRKTLVFNILAIICIILFCVAISPVTMQNDTYYTVKVGESIIENVEYILRGYDDFDKKIEALKGKIVLQN